MGRFASREREGSRSAIRYEARMPQIPEWCMSSILADLTEVQRQAASHMEGPLLVLAGPGSGKTRVVTHRIAHLLRSGVRDWEILALTFTNKGADEMRQRVDRLVPGHQVWVSTFHRFCARLLRQYATLSGLAPNYSILDTDDSQVLLKRALQLANVDSRYQSPNAIARAISSAKAATVTAESYQARTGEPLDTIVAEVYPLYQQQLLQANSVDFDDLLLHVATLLRDNPDLRAELDRRYRFILVDEYQDTNLAQYAIVRGLSVLEPNLSVTGDPDQSIYGWRGANVGNILEFEQDYPATTVIRLEQNFRSTQSICRVADHLISHNLRRKQKSLITANPEGVPVRQTRYSSSQEEAQGIAARIEQAIRDEGRRAGDFAIFYRTNALSRQLEQGLRQRGISYQVIQGVAFYQRKEIKDVLAYLQLMNNPQNDAALLRIINVPPRGIGKQTLQKMSQFAQQERLSLLDAALAPTFHQSLAARARKAVREFAELQVELSRLVDQPLESIIGHLLERSGYVEYLESARDNSDVDRAENVRELLGEAREFDARYPEGPWLESYLERVSLVNDVDDWDESSSSVSLMTIHASKGLEFPVVFLVGLEQGILPHERSRHSEEGIEEERRLLFVGMTRAREELYLSHADRRMRSGTVQTSITSPFLMELPSDWVERSGYGRGGMSAGYPGEGDDFFGAPSGFGEGMDDTASDFAHEPGWEEPVWDGDSDGDSDAGSDGGSSGEDSRGELREGGGGDFEQGELEEVEQVVEWDADAVPWDPDNISMDRPRKRGKRPRKSKPPAVMGPIRAASELLGDSEATGRSPLETNSATSPDRFTEGMLVHHPEYGLGTVVALAGRGPKRTASVRFFQADGATQQFYLAYSPLTPVRSEPP
jgi:DNA helicase II / ATP-dependent DNA helicase PcrA